MSDDDLVWEMGITVPNEVSVSTVSSARLSYAPTRSSLPLRLMVKGYLLGVDETGRSVLFDGAPAPGTVTSWSPTLIVLALDEVPADGSLVSVDVGPTTTRSVTIIDERGPTAASEAWALY